MNKCRIFTRRSIIADDDNYSNPEVQIAILESYLMEDLQETIEKIKALHFEIEKAEFNYQPTEELLEQQQPLQMQLIDQLTTVLQQYVSVQLPPLQVDNPRPQFDLPIPQDLYKIIEAVGIEDDDDTLLLQLDGTNHDHYYLLLALGSWYIHLGKADLAVGYYQELLQAPTDLVYYNLSYALAVQNILTPALEYLDQISDNFSQGLVFLNRGVIYDRLGRYDEVKSSFEQAIETDEARDQALYNWGLAAMGFGKQQVADRAFKLLLQVNPRYPGLHFQLGQLAAAQGLYPEAITAFEIAWQSDPNNLEILADLATACLMAKKYHDAIDYYQEYLKQNTSISVLNNLGAAYLQTQQYREAVDTLDQALELNPSHKQTLKNIKVARSYLS